MANTAVFDMNGRKVVLTFGLGFLEMLNSKYTVNTMGIDAGAGVNRALAEIQMGNVAVIKDIILFGTMTNRDKPTLAEIEDYIMTNMEDDDKFVEMMDNFFDIWKKIPGARLVLKNLQILEEPQTETEEKKITKKKTIQKNTEDTEE